jgi:hypothetical protein
MASLPLLLLSAAPALSSVIPVVFFLLLRMVTRLQPPIIPEHLLHPGKSIAEHDRKAGTGLRQHQIQR